MTTETPVVTPTGTTTLFINLDIGNLLLYLHLSRKGVIEDELSIIMSMKIDSIQTQE